MCKSFNNKRIQAGIALVLIKLSSVFCHCDINAMKDKASIIMLHQVSLILLQLKGMCARGVYTPTHVCTLTINLYFAISIATAKPPGTAESIHNNMTGTC